MGDVDSSGASLLGRDAVVDDGRGLPRLSHALRRTPRPRRHHCARRVVLVALLAIALSASLWWTYFSDERDVEWAMQEAPPRRRNHLALVAFGYWHYGLLLGIVAVAAGLKKAVGAPYDPLDGWIASELASGVALFLACDVGFRRTLGIAGGEVRLAAAVVCVLTIPLGIAVAGVAQVGLLAAIVAGALVLGSTAAPALEVSASAPALRRRGS